MMMNPMDFFMKAAIEEAKIGLREGGIPIGSILVKNDKIIGRGHNRRVPDNDPLAHAEIVCLRNAGRIIKYQDTILYSTLMPCYLCAGAIVQFGIKKVIVGESKNFRGAREFMESHGVDIIDLDDFECKKMMQEFINNNDQIWNEDIGK
jgi:creatinine deaminase